MNYIQKKIKDLEIGIWNAAMKQDGDAFSKIVDENAVMVCGGYRCTGKEYAQIISEFDLASYEISDYETVYCLEEVVQNHYVIKTTVKEERNLDLEGKFQITSTWKKQDEDWKLIYNMDSRIMGADMDGQDYRIRTEEEKDYHKVESLMKRAFWNLNEPGCMEHYLSNQLRGHKDFIPELDFVLELNNQVIASVMYTKAKLIDEEGKEKEILSFGPIGVEPEFQRRGYGKALLEASFQKAEAMGYDVIAIFGNPDNYVARGFKSCKKYNVCMEGSVYPAALLVKELKEGCLAGKQWIYKESDGCNVDMSGFEQFDAGFEQLKKEYRTCQEEFYIHSHSKVWF